MSYGIFDFTGDEDFENFRFFVGEDSQSGYPPPQNEEEYHELKACTFLHSMKEDDDFKKFEYIYDASHGYPEPRSEEEYLYMKYLAFKQQRSEGK